MQILLGTDGSTHARLAEALLARLPEWRKAEVTVASVAPQASLGLASLGPNMGEPAAQQLDEAIAIAARDARDHADAAVQRFGEQEVRATAAYLEGDPGHALLDFAERNRFDAIAIGSRGMGAIQSLLLGSVARKLVAHAPCHVMVARASKGRTPEASLAALEGAPKLVAVAGVDGSAGSQIVLDFIKRQGANAFEGLVAVCAEPLSVVPAGIDPAGFVDLYRYDHERAEGLAQGAAQALAGSAPQVGSATGLGRPAWVVGEKAREHDADLVIVGATRHGGFERFLIGSVSYELATDAPCSVLVVRPARA